jgi:hypothetical protein
VQPFHPGPGTGIALSLFIVVLPQKFPLTFAAGGPRFVMAHKLLNCEF